MAKASAVRLVAYLDQDKEAADIAEQIRAAVAAGPAHAERLCDFLSRECAVAVARAGATRGGRAVPNGSWPGVLRAEGN